jgi:hypothetical protein
MIRGTPRLAALSNSFLDAEYPENQWDRDFPAAHDEIRDCRGGEQQLPSSPSQSQHSSA